MVRVVRVGRKIRTVKLWAGIDFLGSFAFPISPHLPISLHSAYFQQALIITTLSTEKVFDKFLVARGLLLSSLI